MSCPFSRHISVTSLIKYLLLFVSLLGVKEAYATHSTIHDPTPPHPYLLTTPTRLAQLRQALHTTTWQTPNWLRLKRRADELLAQEVVLPPRAGNWEPYYIDSVSGMPLTRGRQLADWQWEHYNAQTGQRFGSTPTVPKRDYDGVVIGFIHNIWAVGVVQLGLAYQISHDKRYAAKARQILLAYAELYPQLFLTNKSQCRNPKDLDTGKIHVETLYDALWLIDMAQGADLIWSQLSRSERRRLQQQLFLPAAHLVDQPVQPTPNIVCWEKAAVGMVGLLLQDKALIKRALSDSTRGFAYQVAHHITPEGFWAERATGYQFYAAQALITLGQAATNAGYAVDLAPLGKLLAAPLPLLNAELALPAFNDSHPVALLEHEYLYEWAYAQFHDPAFALPLHQTTRGHTFSRGPLFLDWALLYGEPTLPPLVLPTSHSVNFPDTGFGLLAKGASPAPTLLYLKYTPYMGGHSHREQLSFVLQKGAESIAVDPGVNTYADPAQWLWYKTSAAHNTFLIDKNLQHASSAQCLAFGQSAGVDYITLETRSAYDSVRFVRTAALLTENLVLFVDQAQVRRPAKHLDIAYHQAGHWLDTTPTDPFRKPLGGGGFRLLEELRVRHQQVGASLLGQLPSGRQVRVTADTAVPTEVITARDPALTNGEVSSVFFQRPVSTAGFLAWCLSLDGQPVAIQVEEVPVIQAAARALPQLRVTVRPTQGAAWQVLINTDEQPTACNSKVLPPRLQISRAN